MSANVSVRLRSTRHTWSIATTSSQKKTNMYADLTKIVYLIVYHKGVSIPTESVTPTATPTQKKDDVTHGKMVSLSKLRATLSRMR
jgi:hypothetical protein